MIKNMRCEHCGRKRKPSHERHVGLTGCLKLSRHPENRSGYKRRYREIHGGSIQKP